MTPVQDYFVLARDSRCSKPAKPACIRILSQRGPQQRKNVLSELASHRVDGKIAACLGHAKVVTGVLDVGIVEPRCRFGWRRIVWLPDVACARFLEHIWVSTPHGENSEAQ